MWTILQPPPLHTDLIPFPNFNDLLRNSTIFNWLSYSTTIHKKSKTAISSRCERPLPTAFCQFKSYKHNPYDPIKVVCCLANHSYVHIFSLTSPFKQLPLIHRCRTIFDITTVHFNLSTSTRVLVKIISWVDIQSFVIEQNKKKHLSFDKKKLHIH